MYIISHKNEVDDDIDYICLDLISKNKQTAWKKFLKLVGKDRKHWNKLGYVAYKIKKITIEF